jgi:two-component system NtrC family sensor kinase
LELEKVKLERWLSLLSMILFSLISFWSYGRYFVKKRTTLILEKRIKRAIKKQEEQQRIIFHQASLSSLGELAAGMAHEINQPLQDLKLCAEYLDFTLRENHATELLFKQSINEIYQDIDRIKKIVDHVRLFSSQQKNHVESVFEIKPIILNALAMISRQYAKKEIELELDLKDHQSQIKGNPYKLEQLIINLLTNAKDALQEKERRTIEPFKKKIEIMIMSKDNFLVIRIKDNGIGLKQSQTKRIFRPFYTTKKLGKGTGLGLSIVQGIIEEFGGEKKVTSTYMKGTVFEIYIPKHFKNRHATSKKAGRERAVPGGHHCNKTEAEI